MSNLEYLKPCLENLIQTTIHPEIIIVNNNSNDGTDAYLHFMQKRYPNLIKFISLSDNLGFPGSINAGLDIAQGEMIVLLNDDVLTTPRWNTILHSAMDAAEQQGLRVGLASPVTNYAAAMCRIADDDIPVAEQNPWHFAQKLYTQCQSSYRLALWLPAFALMVKREVFDTIGQLDERFFPGGCEDIDFAIRALEAGYHAIVAEGVFVFHHGSKTLNKHFPQMACGNANWSRLSEKWYARRQMHQRIALATYLAVSDSSVQESLRQLSQRLNAPLITLVEHSPSDDPEAEAIKAEAAFQALLDQAHQQEYDWIMFVDKDDIIDPHFNAERLRILCSLPNPLALFFKFPTMHLWQGMYAPDPAYNNLSIRLYRLLPHFKTVKDLQRVQRLSYSTGFRIFKPLDIASNRVGLLPFYPDYQISLCMISKNEAQYVDSFMRDYRPLFHEVIVNDTGSVDDTVERLQRWGVKCLQNDWHDFSTARNQACAYATMPWIMHMDWDEDLLFDDQFLFQNHLPDIGGYLAPIESLFPNNKPALTENIRLFRNMPEIRYRGRVHESVGESLLDLQLPVGIAQFQIRHYGYLKSPERIQSKLEQYEQLLLEDLHDDPFRARAYYDLAIQYINDNEIEHGREFLKKAIILAPHLVLPRKELAFEHLAAAHKGFVELMQMTPDTDPVHQISQHVLRAVNQVYTPRVKVGLPNA
jgi:GT2 family glycosyltransferase